MPIPKLAQKIAESLDSRMGNATVGQFSDSEIAVEINGTLRGKDVFDPAIRLCPHER